MAQKGQPYIEHKDFYLGGVADSKYAGIPRSMYRMVGWDLHSEPGLLKVNQKMTKDSSTVIDEFCKVAIACSNGIRYWFSSTSGKIWQEKNGTYTLVYTTSPGAGAAACTGAKEYQGYMYWATQSRLHRIPVATADGSSAWTTNAVPNWATFTKTDATFHPMEEVNLVLYIGDGNLVAQVDAGVFSANALDITTPYRISALGKIGTDLLIGTYVADEVNSAEVFRWDTYSTSFAGSDPIPENGINCFLKTDNIVLVNAGQAGNIYLYTGAQLEFYKKIPGLYSPTKKAKINPNASDMFRGSIPIFGVSNVTGNPCDQGIWSLGRHSRNYNNVFNLEFPISTVDGDGYHVLSNVEIGAVLVVGVDVYMSCQYQGTGGFVDKLDYSNKIAKPFFETKVIAPDRVLLTTFPASVVHYESLPDNTSIVMKYKTNHAASYANAAVVNDTIHKWYVTENESVEAKTLQVRVECVSSGNDAPTIEELDVLL